MGKKVFANKMAIAAQAGDGKLVAAFPDVCNSPPGPPAGPVPVPYPNSAFARDLKKGTKRVKIGGKPAGVEHSYLASSPLGNEAATKSFGGALLSHTTTGKAYFGAYSMDVSFEGRKVVRHLDLMTSNHGSYPGSTPPFAELEEMALAALSDEGEAQALCPCCWSARCAAALPPKVATSGGGDVEREPLGFREFYNLDEVDGSGAPTARAAERVAELAAKPCAGGSCPNAGKAVRKSDPPCDVYRVTTPGESQAIKRGIRDRQKFHMRIRKGVPGNKDLLAQRELRDPAATAAALARLPGWSVERMRKEIQLDHTTPRAAGGCPTSPQNIEAHGLKCANCKDIDERLDIWNGQELQERRRVMGVAR